MKKLLQIIADDDPDQSVYAGAEKISPVLELKHTEKKQIIKKTFLSVYSFRLFNPLASVINYCYLKIILF